MCQRQPLLMNRPFRSHPAAELRVSVLRVLVVARRLFHRDVDNTSMENAIRWQVRADACSGSMHTEHEYARSRVGPSLGSVVQEPDHAGPVERDRETEKRTYSRALKRCTFVVAHRLVL